MELLGDEMKRLSLMAAGMAASILLISSESSLAQFERSRRTVPANNQSKIYFFWNCRNDIIQSVSGQAERGQITTQQTTQRRCGNRTQRVIEVVYTPPSGYKGPDDVYIYSGSGQMRVYLDVK
jgi:hypothetical protein